MHPYKDVLSKSALFHNITQSDLAPMLSCLGAQINRYRKHSPIYLEGDAAQTVGVVLSGSVQITKEDYSGNRSILAVVATGNLFAEAYACAGEQVLPISVFAAEDSDVMRIDCRKIIDTCPSVCAFHKQLIRNLLQILAEKNILLNRKLEVVSQRTTRDKLLVYLSGESKKAPGQPFSIPFNRQELADYLGVDRSAMSTELGKLKREGILDYHKNIFRFLS